MIQIPANNSIKILETQTEQFDLEGKSYTLVNWVNANFFKILKKEPNSILIIDELYRLKESDLNEWLADAQKMEIYIIQMKNNEYYINPEIIKV